MARNTPLGNVVAMLKAEVGTNMITGVAVANDLNFASLIAEKQRWLADTFDWPFLENDWDIPVGGGGSTRYLPLPTAAQDDQAGQEGGVGTYLLNQERPFQVSVFFSNYWQPLLYGISEEEYNYINSDLLQTLDPVQRWRFSEETMFEIWPVPQTNTLIRFRGQRQCGPLLTFNDGGANPSSVSPQWQSTLDLDDLMVMLFAAGEYLQLLGKANAQAVMARAQNRMQQIRGNYPKRTMDCAFGQSQLRQYNKIIPVKKILVA